MFTSNDPRKNTETKEPLYQAKQEFEPRQALGALADRNKDEAWVHWTYSPEEWKLFERVDWNSKHLLFWVLVSCEIVSLSGVILSWILFPPGRDTNLFVAVYVTSLFLLVACFIGLISWLPSYVEVRRRHKARQKLPRTVTFSKKGVWEAGTFFPLNEKYEGILKKVTLTSEPSVLHFHLAKPYGRRGSVMTVILHVLVPREQAGEVGQLIERFQTEVIQVREQEEERERQERERRLHPPEPR